MIPTHLMYSLGNWWSHRLEEQGFLQHGQNEMALLRPPLQGAYEETLLYFVGGWESARQMLAEIPDRYDEFDWTNARDLLKLNVRHINQTCLMLLKAVARGDQAAAEWLSDVISKWWAAASSSDDEPFCLFGKTDFITIETVNREWSVVDKSLCLDDNDKRLLGNDETIVQKHVCFAALKNYWWDIRLLTLEIILSWAAEEQSQLGDRSLAVYVASSLLTGRNWRGGGRTEESLGEMSASDYLTAKCRQFAADSNYREGYIELLDSFVESAVDILRPQMVSGRGYSFSGADDVRSLQEAQLILFVILSGREWGLGESLRRQLAIWTSSNFRSTELLKDRSDAMKSRLEEIGDSLCPKLVDQLISQIGNSLEPSDGIKRTQIALDLLSNEITNLQSDAVSNAQVSKQRLIEIEEGASKIGFSQNTGEFPLQLFSSINYEALPQHPFTLIFSNLRKGEFTEVEMAQRAINELEHFAKTVANHVGMLLLSDVIRKCEIRDVFATDATAYWSALKAEAKILKDSGLTPILILDNPTRPDWMWEWKIARKGGDHPRPADLFVRRETQSRGHGYIADFNDIQVFCRPIVPGESLLVARETFSSVTFRTYRENVFTKAVVTEAESSKTLVNLQLMYERKVEVEHNKIIRIHYN